ncbi:MAG: phospholipase D-like domain-containing protein [Proteobacteria bacterium]|nr:phospholipase D-like domain-containing protein [Pseudomonadota bacterium]
MIDKQIVITGSFNFSKAAEEKNAENLLILKNPELAGIYIDNFLKHRAHSEKMINHILQVNN